MAGFDLIDYYTGDIVATASDKGTAKAFVKLNKLRVESGDENGYYVTPGTRQTMNFYGGVDTRWLKPMAGVTV